MLIKRAFFSLASRPRFGVMDVCLPDPFDFTHTSSSLDTTAKSSQIENQATRQEVTAKAINWICGACNHDYTLVNEHLLAPTPRTDGGVSHCEKETSIPKVDHYLPNILKFFGGQMDRAQYIMDKICEKYDYNKVFNDFARKECFASKL
jgi:hypothetical protein